MNKSGDLGTGIIDVHLHCFTAAAMAKDVGRQIETLRSQGVTNVAVAGMVNHRFGRDEIWGLVPGWVENHGNRLFHEADHLLELARVSQGFIIPLLDTRYLWGNIPGTISGYVRGGFRGIKGIYLPDGENDLGVKGVPATFGITLGQYRKREWEIFSVAQMLDLPVLYHIDARRYGETMTALLDDFPEVRINVPHFGIGRKSFSKALDRYPNLYTDFAGLLSHIQQDPAGYRDFIVHYQDRVCFGSDEFLYKVEGVSHYLEAFRRLELPDEVVDKVCRANPRSLLGNALAGANA